MDFELEVLCWNNAERRKWAEQVDREMRLKARREAEEARWKNEQRKWHRWGRNVKAAGQVHLFGSAVLALMGLPVWAVMGLAGAAFYYLCAWEFRAMERRHGN